MPSLILFIYFVKLHNLSLLEIQNEKKSHQAQCELQLHSLSGCLLLLFWQIFLKPANNIFIYTVITHIKNP